jgi:hypothetical protein
VASTCFSRTKRRGHFSWNRAAARVPARRIDAGKTPINEVLAAMQPRLHLFGHHHQYRVEERQKVTSIGLELVTESYVVFDGKSLAHQRFKTYSP